MKAAHKNDKYWVRFLLRRDCSTGMSFMDELVKRSNIVKQARDNKRLPPPVIAQFEVELAAVVAEYVNEARWFNGKQSEANAQCTRTGQPGERQGRSNGQGGTRQKSKRHS